MIKITFPDGSTREFESGVTGMQIAESISPRLAKEVLSVNVNDETIDLARPITTDAKIKLNKWDDATATASASLSVSLPLPSNNR